MGDIDRDGMDFSCDLGRRITQSTQRHSRVNPTLQCGRCLGYLRPHNPRRRNVAVPALVLDFSLMFLALGIYTTEGQQINQ